MAKMAVFAYISGFLIVYSDSHCSKILVGFFFGEGRVDNLTEDKKIRLSAVES